MTAARCGSLALLIALAACGTASHGEDPAVSSAALAAEEPEARAQPAEPEPRAQPAEPEAQQAEPEAQEAAPETQEEEAPPAQPPSTAGASVFFIGHSLVNHDVPKMVECLALDAGHAHRYAAHIGIGASLSWIWEHPERGEGPAPRTELATGTYDALVMTEAVPITEHSRFSDTSGYAARFAELAVRRRPTTQVYLYEVWDHRRDARWPRGVESDRAIWERLADEIDARIDGPPVRLVPGGTALRALMERVRARRVPGVPDDRAIFVDDIHLTDLGNYFIALVQYATIYRRSPAGRTAACQDRFGQPFDAIRAETARAMQELAWEVVSRDARAGVAAR